MHTSYNSPTKNTRGKKSLIGILGKSFVSFRLLCFPLANSRIRALPSNFPYTGGFPSKSQAAITNPVRFRWRRPRKCQKECKVSLQLGRILNHSQEVPRRWTTNLPSGYHINLWTPGSWYQWKGRNKNIHKVKILIPTKRIPIRSHLLISKSAQFSIKMKNGIV